MIPRGSLCRPVGLFAMELEPEVLFTPSWEVAGRTTLLVGMERAGTLVLRGVAY